MVLSFVAAKHRCVPGLSLVTTRPRVLGISTPKQMAKTLVKFSSSYLGLRLSRFIIPQRPAALPAARPCTTYLSHF